MKRVFFFSFFIFPFFLFGEQLIEIADAETEQCPNGGIKIITGNDDDNNGSLEENEIKATKIVCNGKDGANGTDGENGKQALVRTSDEAAGENCEAGGTKIEVGIDSNGDGELDEEEIDSNSTKYICNGKNGFQTIIKTSDPEAGFCLYGGTKIEVGLDKNGNGELDEGEIDSTRHICNDKDGKNGTDGENGQKALVRTSKETAGENCEAGGTKIEVGLDSNGDGELDEGEIDSNSTQYICNGKDGKNGTDGEKGEAGEKGEKGADGVKGEKGETGETGETGEKGKKGEKGEAGEKGEKGPNGAVALVAVTDESAGENCTAGGKKIEIGLDANGNGELDEDEINRENVFFVCNGADAEESGLASSSTGCAILSVDGGEDAVFGIFSMILICCALFFKKILQI